MGETAAIGAGAVPSLPVMTQQQGQSLQEQLAGMTALQAWGSGNQPLGAVRDFVVIPAAEITSGSGFNAAALVFATAAQFTDEPDVRVALANSERRLLDLAAEIQRKLRPTDTDRVIEAVEALAERINVRGDVAS